MATPSPTPSEDNRKNTGEIAMKNALDKVMTNPVQSYDAFLNSFTYLKQGMQDKRVTNKEVSQSMISALKSKMSPSQKKSNSDLTNARTDSSKVFSVSDDIEEEVLCEGYVTCRIAQTKVIKTGAIVKFDNYVEEADEGDMEDIPGDGYMASFSADKPASTRARKEPMSDVDSDNMSDLCQSMSLDENSTDKLLMNFLADLQNEMNDNTVPNAGSDQSGVPNASSDQSGVPGESSSAMDIQKFLNRNKKQVSDGVTFNDNDDDDTIYLLQDDSENNKVKVIINKHELDDELEKTAMEDKKTKLHKIYRNALMDSEGVIRAHYDAEDTDQTEEVMEVKDLVFPGQVEETNDEHVYENETLLDFKATYRTEQQSSEVLGEDECNNTIQPFQLDEDFDYDNVVLTPKFSTEDLKALKMTVTPKTVVL